ncbi:MAG TPA: hypothetical protein ENH10_06715, partial [Bacteroidetes bacterium]|nr:hypothetical protein [Bacteroidota bacterium]HEX04834.1 hypothetical protein [Bacteroidota bacterium]
MKYLSSIILVLMLVCVASAQTDPPSGLEATLNPGGSVDLTWNVPSAGLMEDFSDGIGQGFNWLTTGGVFSIDGGYAKMDMTNATAWGTGAYEDMEFGNFFLETNFQIVGTSTSSRGHMWCTNGPRDADFNGYGMYVSGGSYSIWRYDTGVASVIQTWTAAASINQGDGALNNLQCDASGGTYDVYINGTYILSFTDATYPQGYAGLITAYGANTWYDDIMCTT